MPTRDGHPVIDDPQGAFAWLNRTGVLAFALLLVVVVKAYLG